MENAVIVYIVKNEAKIASHELLFLMAQDYFKTLGLVLNKNDWQITYNDRGKPSNIKYPQIHFSISHSGLYWLVAFGHQNLGIDVQLMELKKKNSNDHYLKLAKRFFNPSEINYLNNSLDIKQSFFLIWCAKESYVKYLGSGISNTFDRFSCLLDNDALFTVDSKLIKWKVDNIYYYQKIIASNYLFCLATDNLVDIQFKQVDSLKKN